MFFNSYADNYSSLYDVSSVTSAELDFLTHQSTIEKKAKETGKKKLQESIKPSIATLYENIRHFSY